MRIVRIIALGSVWCALTRELTFLNVVLGLVLASLLVRAANGSRGGDARVLRRIPRARTVAAAARRALARPVRALELAGFFLYELVLSNARIALLMLRPRLHLSPTTLDVAVDAESDEELALLSDLVTLTPGTLTLDVADDGRTLLVHVLSAEDDNEVRRLIRDGLGRRVRRLFE